MKNDMGVDPDEWFDKPDPNRITDEYAPCDVEHDVPAELRETPTSMDTYASRFATTPDHEKTAEEVVTMHEKMYRIATAKYNPFAIGGTENLLGGSEERLS
tara:strand:+ start:694 stop:996 length:303 start_codon:yes stop_codon:yes gene_type:complete